MYGVAMCTKYSILISSVWQTFKSGYLSKEEELHFKNCIFVGGMTGWKLDQVRSWQMTSQPGK